MNEHDANPDAALDFIAYRHGGRSPREQEAYMQVRAELTRLREDNKALEQDITQHEKWLGESERELERLREENDLKQMQVNDWMLQDMKHQREIARLHRIEGDMAEIEDAVRNDSSPKRTAQRIAAVVRARAALEEKP